MADEFNTSINWWDSSRNRFDNSTDGGGAGGGGAASSSSSSGLTSLGGGGGGGCFSWAAAPDMTEAVKSGGGGSGGGGGRSSMDSVSVSTAADTSADHIHMMGLGLSSHAIDWNQALLRGEKGTDQQHQSSFRSMLQIDNLNSTPPGYSHQQEHGGGGGGGGLWRERSSSSVYSSETGNSMNEFKQIGRGFSLDQPAAVHDFCQLGSDTSGTGFQLGSGGGGGGGGGSMFHGGGGGMMLGSEHNHHGNSLMGNYPHPSYGGGSSSTSSSSTANFGIVGTNDMSSSPNWSSNKVPQFLRSNSPPPPKHTQLHFSNNAPFWNASGSINTDVRPAGGFFPPTNHQQNHQFPAASSFDDKPKNIGEEGNSSAVVVVKKSEGASANKRPRNETAASTLPAFKVRKEKMGDRITALQQLVSPFGKTDTASVLSEAIEYIKFLHDQIGVLSTPYMKSGAPIHHQQSSEHHHQKSKDTTEAQKDLRSRGLCLVPVSSTFPVTHETTVDFWTPTFGGTFR